MSSGSESTSTQLQTFCSASRLTVGTYSADNKKPARVCTVPLWEKMLRGKLIKHEWIGFLTHGCIFAYLFKQVENKWKWKQIEHKGERELVVCVVISSAFKQSGLLWLLLLCWVRRTERLDAAAEAVTSQTHPQHFILSSPNSWCSFVVL